MKILLKSGTTISFSGRHRPEMEKPNWHYYETDVGHILHFRKENMECVIPDGASVKLEKI